ncbi:cytochrome d ubiquinol oxidase subunit II [Rhodococcus sp. D2-41]|uniref:Cytochrome d ubiquinol oxidase subunit II n=1 Tax=Speluncibacter jeojiensis TaxID=2710754 RepID=A0A9X4M5X5_9ACTN|nr:cytochrome d ubiquinol oxidase subunit II [Rhodococcus sp. D2-41]MDG3011597.1 cytochrome d ubiquinol oxidase subunit II [Rhodococcus sp. D2-41]MDG3015046.1 cytochrome d ubiquinol oxidase subunit II [Corynebacteriales bacterium D3-21]
MGLQQWWFILIGVLFTGYFVLEGFDFGVGMLMPMLGRRSDTRRRVMLNTIGPVWDGNEVWLIVGGGAMFAAFPDWYATLFSGFYIPLLVILVALILRICAIEYRGKIDDDKWRRRCDWGIGIGSWVPAILWGVAFANIVRGVPIDADKRVTSGFFELLNPYGILGGVTTALVFALHGAVFLALKSDGEVRTDAVKTAAWLALPAVPVAGGFVLWTQLAHGGKAWTWVFVGLAAIALLAVVALTQAAREGWAFVFTTVAIISAMVVLFGSLFPNVMPSTTDPAYSLTIYNASSSHYTLMVMTWAAGFMTPIVLLYQGWTYWVFRKRIHVDHIPPSVGLPLASAKD